MKDKTLYDKDSIQSLSPLEHVRLRPGVYVGDTSTPTQLVVEIFSNALDEHNLGHGNEITVSIDTISGETSVIDNGQGFPVKEKREDGKTVLQASFDEMNTSGKYSDDGVYQGVAVGLNGQGGKCANFLSHSFLVTTYRDGKFESIAFKEGVYQKRTSGKSAHSSGTEITFTPSEEFFSSPISDIAFLRKLFNDTCAICPNLTIHFAVNDNIEDISHPEGMEYFIDTDKAIIDRPLVFQEQQDKYVLSCAMTYTENNASKIIAYVNHGLTEQGPHISAIKTNLTRTMNKWARENNILKQKEKNLDGDSLQEGVIIAFNLVSPGVKYDAQVKSRIVSNNFVPFINEIFSKRLEIWLDNNPDDGRKIIEKALLARRAAEAARKAREAIKNQKQKKKKNKILHPDKLKDAEYLGEDSTLLVVEGLSAGASVSVARDVSKYGILMLRGKLINAFTNAESKLLKNEEIQLLFQALGIEPHKYDSSNLRYGRVAICTDSDSDGFNIGLLIAVALQYFCPQFIQEGRLCWLRSPLYILKDKKRETYFYTDADLASARKKGKLKGELQRNKGLGSLSAEQARNSMFGENQHIDVLLPEEDSVVLLEQLMGTNVSARKKYIFDNIDFAEVRE